MKGHEDGAAPAAPASLPERLAALPVRLGGALSALLILCVLALTIWSVFMRYVLSEPPVWAEEATGYLLVALIGLGVAEAWRRDAHISIDLLTGGLTARRRRVQAIWSDLCVLAFAAVLGLSAWEAIAFARDFGAWSSGEIEIEMWIPLLPLLAASVLLGLLAIARLAGRLLKKG